MLRSMLIGLDGSVYSNAAIELAIQWAQRFDALVTGLGVVDEPAICKCEPVPIGVGYLKVERDQHLLAKARRRVQELLAKFAQRCDSEGVRYKVIEDVGTPETQIVQNSKQYDLIVLGQKTYFGFESQPWPDETLQNVLRQSSRPVVVVPDTIGDGKAIVIAYDGSPQADRALQAFGTLGLAGGEDAHVLSIHSNHTTAEQQAGQAVDFLKSHGVSAFSHPSEPTTSVDKIILEKVQQLQVRLLVMGACGRPLWQKYVFGSTTTSVLEACPVPLLLCH